VCAADVFAAKFVEWELEDAHGAQPVAACRALENESLTSLWFATKVHRVVSIMDVSQSDPQASYKLKR
jgi:hypothetical protein